MKFESYQMLHRYLLVMPLAAFLISTSISVQSEEKSENIQEKLGILVSSDNPDKDSVREAQKLLVTLEFDPGPIDGVLGSKTRAALKEWKLSSERKVSNAWLGSRKKKGGQSGWKCVSRGKADSHKGPTVCGVRLKSLMIQVGGSGYEYHTVDGALIPPPTGECTECEIYTQ